LFSETCPAEDKASQHVNDAANPTRNFMVTPPFIDNPKATRLYSGWCVDLQTMMRKVHPHQVNTSRFPRRRKRPAAGGSSSVQGSSEL